MKEFELLVHALDKGVKGVGSKDVRPKLLHALPDVNFFILSDAVLPKDYITIDPLVAPPFPTCWFQLAEGSIHGGITDQSGNVARGVLLHETAPNEYILAYQFQCPTTGFIRVECVGVTPMSGYWPSVAQWLQPFKRSIAAGAEKTNFRVKYKLNGEKKLLKIKKVVYILPKHAPEEKKKLDETHTIDWSHRWFVRGHWRKIKGIGKNRAGEYCMGGFTYVIEHEKGKEHVEPMRKTRVIPLPLFPNSGTDEVHSIQ